MRALIALMALTLAACAPKPGSEAEFEAWVGADPERAAHYAHFVTFLKAEGVADVAPPYQLWIVDRLDSEACVTELYAAPPEEAWSHIVPALRFVRDEVKPAIGDVEIVSAYRDEAFNACVRGAPLSAHRTFHALDMVPADPRVTRETLINALCPVHAKAGPRARIGLGIYRERRFHIDAIAYRGWGHDHRGATFPCAASQQHS